MRRMRPDLKRHDAADGLAVGSKHFVKLLCLLQGAGETIQDEAVLALLSLDGVLDDADHDLVRHKPVGFSSVCSGMVVGQKHTLSAFFVASKNNLWLFFGCCTWTRACVMKA
jgi:hypothetical protein